MKSREFQAPRPRPAIADRALTRPGRTGGGGARAGDLLKLDWNENCDPVLGELVAGVIKALPIETPSQYPAMTPLYLKLAEKLGVGADNIVITAGSDGAIRQIFEAYVNPGDDVVLPHPTFIMYGIYCRMFGAQMKTLDYQATPDGPRLDAETVIAAITGIHPKIVCLPNPDSPTGTVFAPERLRAIIEAAAQVGSLVIIDEAYYPFYAETALPWIGDFPNLVVLRSTSKAWAMAGLRIGFAVTNQDIAAAMQKTRPMFEINAIAVETFKTMLDHEAAVMDSVERNLAGKREFKAAMEELGLKTLAAEGNFFHVAFAGKAEFVHDALAGLVLYRRDFEAPCLKGYSRFSAAPADILRPVIDRIVAVVGR